MPKSVADITALDVTYANVLAPVGFHKAMTAKDDCVSADITKGLEGAQVTNLWYQQNDDVDDPIVNVSIIYDDDETPPYFTKVDKDLSKKIQTVVACLQSVVKQLQNIANK